MVRRRAVPPISSRWNCSAKGRVSLGRAAELAGIGVEEFMEFSAHRQVPLHYTAADLAEDHATAERLKL